MGGQVGQARIREWVLLHAVAAVAEQRAGEAARAVHVGGGVAVVDSEDEASDEAPTHFVEPGFQIQADLGDLALGEPARVEAVVRQAAGELWSRRLGRFLDEPIAPGDEELEQPAVSDDDAVDRQGVEELVGKEDADDGHGAVRGRAG